MFTQSVRLKVTRGAKEKKRQRNQETFREDLQVGGSSISLWLEIGVRQPGRGEKTKTKMFS